MIHQIDISPVESRRQWREFLSFGNRLYRDCPCYVPDMEADLRRLFSPKSNPALRYSEIQPFIAYRDGQPAGRIAPFINNKSNEKWHCKDTRFMLLDFIDDMEVSSKLLQTACQWGAARGMNRLIGPIGFTDFDKEGLLVEGFDRMSSATTLYNYPYYAAHLEQAGFSKAADWLQYLITLPKELPPRYAKTASLCRKLYGMHTVNLTRKAILKEGMGQKVFDLLNAAYAPLFGFTEIDSEQTDLYIHTYLPLADLSLVPAVADADGQLAGVAVCLRSMSEALQRTHGRLWPTGWLHLAAALTFKKSTTADLLLIAVRPDCQGKGVSAMLFEILAQRMARMGIKQAETGPQLETNSKELTQWKPLHPETITRRRCYAKETVSSDSANKDDKTS